MAIAILEQIIFGSWIGCGLAGKAVWFPSFLLFVGALYYVCSIDANARCKAHRAASDEIGIEAFANGGLQIRLTNPGGK